MSKCLKFLTSLIKKFKVRQKMPLLVSLALAFLCVDRPAARTQNGRRCLPDWSMAQPGLSQQNKLGGGRKMLEELKGEDISHYSSSWPRGARGVWTTFVKNKIFQWDLTFMCKVFALNIICLQIEGLSHIYFHCNISIFTHNSQTPHRCKVSWMKGETLSNVDLPPCVSEDSRFHQGAKFDSEGW